MTNYKISNITDKLNKRDVNYNKIIDFKFVDGMYVRHIKIEPGDFVVLTISKLPISVQKYKLKNLINIEIIGDDVLKNLREYKNMGIVNNNKKDNIDTIDKNFNSKKNATKRKNEKSENVSTDSDK